MSSSLIQGLRGSLRRRVRREISEHLHDNRAIRRARYSLFQRVIRALIVGRSLPALLCAYVFLDLVVLTAEIILNLYFHTELPGWTAPGLKNTLKDVASYLIAAQVGMLGMVSVAIGIVTLISQRDDRSSTNTDVRLYYRESLASQVIVSGVALLIVLCVQLLWPLQFLAHLVHLGGPDLLFKVILTIFHLAWLLLNLTVFAQFLLTTLHFVEPGARERLRERYTANVIVPSDLALRLSRVFYANAPKELVPETRDESEGPLITFGYGMLTDGEVELRSQFPVPTMLHDVWLRPLGYVLRRWWHRSEQTLPRRRRQSALLGRDVRLSLAPSFDSRLEGEVALCRRRGGATLRAWERWVIRECYRFRTEPHGRDTLPSPSNFLEELADRVIAQIERNAITGFNGAFDELIRFHRFLLDAHNTQTEQGQPISLAEFGGLWEAPYQEWIRQYRRVFERAADQIGVETTFIETLGHTVMRLLPDDAAELSNAVVTSLLDLILHEVIILEAWVTRRTTVVVPPLESAHPRLQLAGSEQRAYEHVVRSLIGAWENVLRTAETLYGLRSREGRPRAEQWKAFGTSLPFLDKHLRNTAFLLASAIWNEDEFGAERYRDCLLRWMDTLRPDLQDDFLLIHHALLTTDLFAEDWSVVETRLQSYRRHPWPELPPPEAVFGLILRGLFDDVVLVSAVLALAWYVNGQQSTDIGARAAALLLRRQVIEGEGSRFPTAGVQPPTVFRSLFSLVVRSALIGDGKYGAGLDGLVRFLNGMSERRVVPGRVYTSWGWRGLDEMHPQVVAILGATIPAQGDDGAIAWVRQIAANDTLFADGDTALRRIDSSLNACAQALGQHLDLNRFERGVHALAPDADVEAVRARLHALFTDAVAVIHEERTQRLRERPIDLEKWNTLADALSNALAPKLYCLRDFRVEKNPEPTSDIAEFRITGIDKARFVTPTMAWESANDLNSLIVDGFRDCLTSQVWRSFAGRQRQTVQINDSIESLWDAVAESAERVGHPATLLTAYDPIGAMVSRWSYSPPDQRPADWHVEYVQGHASGAGTGYVGTVDGIEVFSADLEDHHSYVFSARMLESVSYRKVTPEAFISLDFEEGDDPWKGVIVVRYHQDVVWRETPIIDLVTESTSEDQEVAAEA